MHTLKNWKAKRAGGRITIYGTNASTGFKTKIVGVDAIEPINGKILATDKHGEQFELLAA